MMSKEQALKVLEQVIGELPFKVVSSFKLVEVYKALSSTEEKKAVAELVK